VFGYVVTAIALVCAGAVAAILALAALGQRRNGRRLQLMPKAGPRSPSSVANQAL